MKRMDVNNGSHEWQYTGLIHEGTLRIMNCLAVNIWERVADHLAESFLFHLHHWVIVAVGMHLHRENKLELEA